MKTFPDKQRLGAGRLALQDIVKKSFRLKENDTRG